MVLTAFIVNLRHALYSASMAPYLRSLSPLWKGLLAYLLTDEAYAVVITRYLRGGTLQNAHWYFLGAGLTLWTGWQISTAVGIFLGAQVPSSWMLDFSLALTFIALVVPALKDRPATLAALVAGVTALAAYGLPYKLGLIIAALVGITVGMWSEAKWQKSG
jgi:predicted branched-subunit amino acid permease